MSPETQKIFEMVKIIIAETDFTFDQTKRGRIVEVLSNNRYKVQIQDKTYTIKSYFSFSVDEAVLVLFPQGRDNSDDLYIYQNKSNVIASEVEPNISSIADGTVWFKT